MSVLIATTKNHLSRIIPSARNIEIKLCKEQQYFISKIHIHVPGHILHAEKKASTPWEALDFSCEAVIKQVQKIKNKKEARRKNKKWDLWKSESIPIFV